jgi:hypothetical protein
MTQMIAYIPFEAHRMMFRILQPFLISACAVIGLWLIERPWLLAITLLLLILPLVVLLVYYYIKIRNHMEKKEEEIMELKNMFNVDCIDENLWNNEVIRQSSANINDNNHCERQDITTVKHISNDPILKEIRTENNNSSNTLSSEASVSSSSLTSLSEDDNDYDDVIV